MIRFEGPDDIVEGEGPWTALDTDTGKVVGRVRMGRDRDYVVSREGEAGFWSVASDSDLVKFLDPENPCLSLGVPSDGR